MHDFQLDAVGIVKEDRVIPRQIRVLLRAALDLGALCAQPVGPLVDDGAGAGLEREVVQADLIAVVRPGLSLCASRRPSEQPAPDRYQIVSPRSPSTSPIRWKPSGASRSR